MEFTDLLDDYLTAQKLIANYISAKKLIDDVQESYEINRHAYKLSFEDQFYSEIGGYSHARDQLNNFMRSQKAL